MQIVHYLLLAISCFGIIIQCQNSQLHPNTAIVSDNIDNHGLYGSAGSSCSSNNYRQHTAIITGCIVGGGTGLILLLVGTILCCRRCKGRPPRTNSKFVDSTNHGNYQHDMDDITLFKSGIWSNRYFQYGKWHGLHAFTLLFDPQLSKITGSGSDDIGAFTIDGIYSRKTKRIGMIKTYQIGTNHRLAKSGHRIIIQLIWNAQTHQFEGKWYIQTKLYRGEDKFELKFGQQQPSIMYERV